MTRVEIEALEVGRELNRLVSLNIFGMDKVDYVPYSENIATAWEVIDKMYEKGYESSLWMTDDYEDDVCYKYTEATFFKPLPHTQTECDGRTTAEAICKCALLAVMALE